MSTTTIPSLPQNDSPFQQQQRRSALAQQQQLYTYNFDSRLQPLGIAAQVPRGDGHTFAWLDGIATTALQLLGNYLSLDVLRPGAAPLRPRANPRSGSTAAPG